MDIEYLATFENNPQAALAELKKYSPILQERMQFWLEDILSKKQIGFFDSNPDVKGYLDSHFGDFSVQQYRDLLKFLGDVQNLPNDEALKETQIFFRGSQMSTAVNLGSSAEYIEGEIASSQSFIHRSNDKHSCDE